MIIQRAAKSAVQKGEFECENDAFKRQRHRKEPMPVRTHLQEARRARGLTQREAAGALFISKDSLSRYERGEQEPGLEVAMRLSRYYQVAMDKLFEIDDKHNA